jgi:hypothetical protein
MLDVFGLLFLLLLYTSIIAIITVWVVQAFRNDKKCSKCKELNPIEEKNK